MNNGYDFRAQNNYGGYDPMANPASMQQRPGYNGEYAQGNSPYGQNRNYYDIDKRTESITMFSDNGVMLKCAFINDSVSITMCPGTLDPGTGKAKYPKENWTRAMLTPERLVAMDDMIARKFIDKVEKMEYYDFGVWTNKDKSTFLQLVTDSDGEALVLHTGINNASGGVPQKSIRFNFREEPLVVENYRADSGEGTAYMIKTQLYLFLKLINIAVRTTFAGSGQEVKVALRYEMAKMENNIRALMNNAGIATEEPRGNQSYNQNNSNGYYEGYNNRNNEMSGNLNNIAPQEISDINQLPF